MQRPETVQKLPKVPSFQPLAKIPNLGAISFVAQPNLPISTGVVSQTTDLHPKQIYALTFIAEQLAIGLAQTLGVLEIYDKPSVNRIMSILNPYIEEIQELDFHIPPKSSREVIIEVTREGKVPQHFHLDEHLEYSP